jgi:hypothetical protein
MHLKKVYIYRKCICEELTVKKKNIKNLIFLIEFKTYILCFTITIMQIYETYK